MPTQVTLKNVLAAALPVAAFALAPSAAGAQTILALTDRSELVRIDAATGAASAPIPVAGLGGALVGVDRRPADGALYGVTDAGEIVVVDVETGVATLRSRLSEPFAPGGAAIVDFNPVADRLRLMGEGGANLRVDVDTGAAVVDGMLGYAPGAGEGEPRIVAGAYTSSVAGAQSTILYTIDAASGALAVQDPPNDGAQRPIGALAQTPPTTQGFDLEPLEGGGDRAWLMADGALHEVDLETGAAALLRPVEGLGEARILDIAVMR